MAAWGAIGARFERACTLLLLPGHAEQGVHELSVLGCPLAWPDRSRIPGGRQWRDCPGLWSAVAAMQTCST